MRVIGGEFRSRRLQSLPGPHLRPTPDILREALFDVLQQRVPGCVFLDAYAGTGAVGIEALSRGAARAIFIEKHRGARRVLELNLAALGLTKRATVVPGAAGASLARHEADIVFLDPPYPLENEYASALAILRQHPPPLVLVQHDKRFRLADSYGALEHLRTLKHGDNVVSFFAPKDNGR